MFPELVRGPVVIPFLSEVSTARLVRVTGGLALAYCCYACLSKLFDDKLLADVFVIDCWRLVSLDLARVG